jgi:uncharacterized membrane protein HdeD (DUF308 family)
MEMTMNRWSFRDGPRELPEGLRQRTRKQLAAASTVAMVVGVLLVLSGLFALYSFATATLVSVLLLGGLLIAGGVFYGINAFSAGHWALALIDVLACALYIVAGVVAFRQPLLTASVVTLVLSVMYVFQGIVRTAGALAIRPPQWGWMLFNGLITLLFGVIVFIQWPISALWLLGILIGTDMLLSGWTIILGGAAMRKAVARSA